MKLSIIIPAYNESRTIATLIDRVKKSDIGNIDKEILVIDDGSTDGTKEIVKKISDVELIEHEKNKGKGAAIKTGFLRATGDFVIIQDADLELDPNDYPDLLSALLDGRADVVYGSRYIGSKPIRASSFVDYYGNKALTFFSNLLSGIHVTDMEIGYKLFKREVVDAIKHKLSAPRFGIEVELTALVAKGKWNLYEVGVSYHYRPPHEGKKMRKWREGVLALWYIVKYNLLR